MAKDRFGYGTELTSEAFKELKSITDDDGVDVGKYLNSKAFSEWLKQEYEPSDDKQIRAIYKSILGSFEDEKEAQEIGSKFLNIIAANKPNNPWV